MVSIDFASTVNGLKFSKGSIDIHANNQYDACKQLKDTYDLYKLTNEEILYILNRLVSIGIIKKCDEGYYTNDEFDWDEYEGSFFKDVRYLVSCELDTIEEPGVRKRNVIVNWNGLSIDKLHKSIKTKLGEKFENYSIYVTNLVRVDLISKE